jgi:hypothetical protein
VSAGKSTCALLRARRSSLAGRLPVRHPQAPLWSTKAGGGLDFGCLDGSLWGCGGNALRGDFSVATGAISTINSPTLLTASCLWQRSGGRGWGRFVSVCGVPACRHGLREVMMTCDMTVCDAECTCGGHYRNPPHTHACPRSTSVPSYILWSHRPPAPRQVCKVSKLAGLRVACGNVA